MQKIDNHLQTYGKILMKISRDFVVKELGDRIMTINDYTKKLNVSRGTIQGVLKFLEDENCVTLIRKGHQGTYIHSIDYDKTWEYTGWNHLTGTTELPLNNLAAGLATGVCYAMKQKKVPFNFMFMQGSNVRVKALLEGRFDFLITSELTARILLDKENIKYIMHLSDTLYAEDYKLFFSNCKKQSIEDGMTVAVDPNSIDQVYLTNQIIKNKKIKVKEFNYIYTYEALKKGEVDFIIGREDVAISNNYKNFVSKDIKLIDSPIKEADKLVSAVIIAAKDNYGLKNLLIKKLDVSLVSKIQQKVISNEMVPNYY